MPRVSVAVFETEPAFAEVHLAGDAGGLHPAPGLRVALCGHRHARADGEHVAAQAEILLVGHLDQPDAALGQQLVQPAGQEREVDDRDVVREELAR